MMSMLASRRPGSMHAAIGKWRWERRLLRQPRVVSYPGASLDVLQCCIAYNEHGGYCVPLASAWRPVAQVILSGQVWERDTLEFMMRCDPDGDIVHAGTYFGDLVPGLARSRRDGAQVWAFEPNPENFRCARLTVELNALENVTLVNAGLGSERATPALRVRNDSGQALGGASHFVRNEAQSSPSECIRVDVVPVDEVVPPDRKVAILQLDVEGYQDPAIRGAMRTIERCKPVVILENQSPGKQDWILDYLASLGYRSTRQLHDNTAYERTSPTRER